MMKDEKNSEFLKNLRFFISTPDLTGFIVTWVDHKPCVDSDSSRKPYCGNLSGLMNLESGKPSNTKLIELGLEDVAKGLWGRAFDQP